MNKFFTKLSVIFSAVFLSFSFNAQYAQKGPDILGATAGDNFGQSAALSADGNTLIVGALFNDDNGNNAGSVHVYTWDGTAWVPKGATIEGQTAGDGFGTSVDISADGDLVIIGAPFNDGNGSNSGQVQAFSWDGSTWMQFGSDIDGEALEDKCGWSVAMSYDGNTFAVGSIGNDGSAVNSGHVRIFEWSSGSMDWSQKGTAIEGYAANDESGTAIALSSDGSIVAVGAPKFDGNGSNSGYVRVYQWSSGWIQKGGSLNGEAAGDNNGRSIALNGTGSILAMGASSNDDNGSNSGHVRLMEWNGVAWSQLGQDIDGENANDFSGISTSLNSDGTIVAIGAIGNSDGGSSAGHARMYNWDGLMWTQLGSDIDGTAVEDRSGSSVDLDSTGSTVAIGAIQNTSAGTESGRVRVYHDTTLVSTNSLFEYSKNDFVNIFPNPSTSKIEITYKNNSIHTIEIYNQLGQLVYKVNTNSNQNSKIVITKDWLPSTYTVRLIGNDQFLIKRLVKL